jgi:hypothetical protein
MLIAECSRCRYRSEVNGDVPAEAMLRCGRCGARGRFLLVSAERSGRMPPSEARAAARAPRESGEG